MNAPPYLRWDESGQQHLLALAEALLQRRSRCLLGIAGAPGAGKIQLFDEALWNEVASLLDETWFVELEQDELLRRLTARHPRFDNDAAIAEWRATGNDEMPAW